MANSKFQTFDHLLLDEEDELMNTGYRVFEQRGGGRGTLFRAQFSQMGIPRTWQRRSVTQIRYNLRFEQLREVDGEESGEAMMDAIATAVDDIVRQQQIPINYRVQLSMNSKEFHHAYSSTIFSLKEWFARSDRVQGLLEHLAKNLNSNESFNPQVGFDVSLMFISQVNPGSGRKLKKDKRGQKVWANSRRKNVSLRLRTRTIFFVQERLSQ